MNRIAQVGKPSTLRLTALLILVFMVTYVGYNQLGAQNLVTCPGLVQQAIDSVGNNCGSLNRNSACYGFQQVAAEFSVPQPVGFFSQPSDRARLLELERLDTSPMNQVIDHWGIALLSVQANLPDTLPGQSVVFMLLGDTQVENAIEPEDAFQTGAIVNVTVQIGAQLFHDPSLDAQMIGSIPPNTALTADAISADGQWVRVAYEGMPGWLTRQVINSADDIDSLPTIGNTPMQAFYFRTSISGTQCTEAPNSLVVQGPQDVAVDINANGADIHLGSTIALYLLPVDSMTQQYLNDQYGDIGVVSQLMQLIVLDGHVILNEGTPDQIELFTGETTFICLSEPENLGTDGEGNDRHVFDACPWAPPRPVTVADIEKFRELDGFTLNYPITLPLTLPTVTPTFTSTSRPQQNFVFVPTAAPTATLTAVPAQPSGNNNPPPATATNTPSEGGGPTATSTPTETATPEACPEVDFDISSGDTQGLIDAINAANDEICFPGMDTIQLIGVEGSSFTFTSADNNTNGPNALPVITSTITISGPGNLYNPDYFFRYFYISPTGNLTLQSVSLDFGSLSGDNGGAIYNAGVLAMTNGSISNSYAQDGAGIYNTGTMTLTDVTIEGSGASGNGGGIYNSGTASVNQSAIYGNNAASGGGVYVAGGSASLLNSTVSTNSGGGINGAGGATRLNFVTVADNTGGGLLGSGFTVKNSIAAGQSPNCSASLTSVAGNFDDDNSCAGFTAAQNLNLQSYNYGVHPLGFPSDAIDATDCTTDLGASVDVDQVFQERPVVANPQAGPTDCDAGAFEYQGGQP